MLNCFAFFLLFILLALVFFLYVSHSLSKVIKSNMERLFVSICFAFTFIGVLAYLFMTFGQFSIFNINLVVALFTVIAAILFKILVKEFKKEYFHVHLKFDTFSLLLFILFGIMFCLNVIFSTQYLLGGRDPGLYAVFGVHIAQTGGLDLKDQLMNELYPYFKDSIRFSYPGIYSGLERGLSSSPGDLIPQFAHMFPAILAIGYKTMGLKGMLSVNAFISILSLGTVYIFSKRLLNRYAALLAVLFLAINPAQIWGARITLTETLSQFLLFFSMYLLLLAFKMEKNYLFIASGIILGLSGFNRIDSHIFIVGIFVIVLYCMFINKNVKEIMEFFFVYIALSGLSIYYLYLRSYPYLYDLWFVSLKALIYLNILCIGIILISLPFYIKFKKTGILSNFVKSSIKLFKKKGSIFISLILTLFVIVGLFIRPYIYTILNKNVDVNSIAYFNAHALEQFLWYVPLLSIILGILGLGALILDKNIKRYLCFVIIGLAGTILYIFRPSITPDQIWASRRWLPISIPFVILLSAFGILYIAEKIKNKNIKHSFLLVCILFVTSFSIYQSSPFMLKSMLNGYIDGYKGLNENIPADAIVFTDNTQIASPLKYIYNRNTYLVQNPDKFIDNLSSYLNKNNRPIYYLGDFSAYKNIKVSFENNYISSVNGVYLEKLRGNYPRKTYVRNMDLPLYRIYSDKGSISKSWLPISPFGTQNGVSISENSIESNGKAGYLLFGPYVKLDKGKYKVTINGILSKTIAQGDIGIMDVVYNQGKSTVKKVILKSEDFENNQFSRNIEFSLDKPVNDAEFRIYVNKDIILQITSIKLDQYNE